MTLEHSNRLANETSPYLLQHAGNPVDWYPWGDEAIALARREEKPIFLSIGYSACHWCHVMAHESFENDSTAALMNENFVCIKVDREERPDLDEIYMTFVQMTTGGGGWPLSVFLTPDLEPFFGGTYFPPEDAYGRRGFPTVLKGISAAWKDRRAEIEKSSHDITQRLQAVLGQSRPPGALPDNVLETAATQLLASFDAVNGGFGDAPKFPPSYALSLLMRHFQNTKDKETLRVVTHTLDKMASGGIYDHLGGGFHRYSVDAQWLVPHFEKMLYDNALLATAYLEACQLTGNEFYLQIAGETLDYVLRDMTDSAGGFHSSEDADSEGEEGKFYVWTPEEIQDVLVPQRGKFFCDYYGVTDAGNFEQGKSILHVRTEPEFLTESEQPETEELEANLSSDRKTLRDLRNRRVRPGKDDKILADWNGLMLTALARGYQVTNESRYLDGAVRCAEFIERELLTDKELLRSYRQGRVKLPGLLTDYAFVANGLVDLYEAGFDVRWLRLADRLAEQLITKFGDQQTGGFYLTLADQDDLILRQKDTYDGALPSGNSMAAHVLARLAVLLDRKEYHRQAEEAFASLAQEAAAAPRSFLYLLNAYDFFVQRPKEVALVGPRDSQAIQALLAELFILYRPNKVVALLDPGSPDSEDLQEYITLLKFRSLVDGQPAAYVCRDFVCRLPVTSASDLRVQLDAR